MSCEKNNLSESLNWCKGKPNIPGIRTRLYYVSKDDLVKFPKLPAAPKTAVEAVTYADDFVLAADKKWSHIDVLSDKSPVTSESQGEQGSVSTLNKATLVHPGFSEEATAFAMQANNDDFVFIIQQRNGKYRVLGSNMFNTTTKVGQELGGAVTDQAGTTIEIEVTDVCPAPFYVGKISTEDGDIDASGDNPPVTGGGE